MIWKNSTSGRNFKQLRNMIFLFVILLFVGINNGYDINIVTTPEPLLTEISNSTIQNAYDPYQWHQRVFWLNGSTFSNNSIFSEYLSGGGTVNNPYIFQNFNFTVDDYEDRIIIEILNSNHFFIIRNCHFQGTSNKYHNTIGILIRDSTNIQIENCSFTRLEEKPIIFENVANSQILSSNFTYLEYGYIEIRGSSDILFHGNLLTHSQGIYLYYSNRTILSFNSFFKNLGSSIQLFSKCFDCQIVSNNISQTRYGIFLGGSKHTLSNGTKTYFGVINCNISRNIIQYSLGYGVYMAYASQTYIYNNSILDSAKIGILLDECFSTNISKNQFLRIREYGINVTDCIDLNLFNNTFAKIGIKNLNGVKIDLLDLIDKNSSLAIYGGGGFGILVIGGGIYMYYKKKKKFIQS